MKIRLAHSRIPLTQLTDQYKWWEQGENDGSAKWTTLHHNGILFPPPYIPLPKNVKMKYDGGSSLLSAGQADRQVSHLHYRQNQRK